MRKKLLFRSILFTACMTFLVACQTQDKSMTENIENVVNIEEVDKQDTEDQVENTEKEDNADMTEIAGIPIAPEGAITDQGDNKLLSTSDYQIVFSKLDDGYKVNLLSKSNQNVMFSQENMASIKVRSKGNDAFNEKIYSSPYETVNQTLYGYIAEGNVTTDHGSIFHVSDSYYIVSDNIFAMERTVKVTSSNEEDAGFSSIVSMASEQESPTYEDFEYFIPSILYKDAANIVPGAIASNLDVKTLYVKETRTGLPMVMARSKASGNGLALMHLQPEISVGNNPGGGSKGEINNDFMYGAIGLTMRPELSVNFIYPCTEAPYSYDAGQGYTSRYHEVEVDNSHSYKIGFIPSMEEKYTDAMIDSYKKAYQAEERYIADIDMEEIYEQNIEIFDKEYIEYTFEGNVTAAGLPWSLDLPNATNKQGVSLQMGFVGQQLPAGFQLYRYGLMNNNEEIKRKGENIVNLWASPSIQDSYFPIVWWDPSNSRYGGRNRSYPSFLRCMVDGMEGMLDAWRVAKAYGEDKSDWYDVIYKYAGNLVDVQNDDGSFYRAYKQDGTVETDESNKNTQGSSKLNTPIAVRFLAKMYECTGEVRFKEAALSAAEYSYHELYMGLGKYVGGTPDNPNTVDKEAAVYALYCFTSAYQLTQDEKYLKAAEHAAVSVMSWTYAYDFAVPNASSEDALMNPFIDGGVIGFSVIATGHSGADNYSAYTFYELFKMYVVTEDSFFFNAASLLENNTKLSTDYDGRVGYKYKALMPEATNVADFSFRSVGTWLPWSGVANIEPITKLYDTFGSMNIEDIDLNIQELQTLLNDYGCGGHPTKRNGGQK